MLTLESQKWVMQDAACARRDLLHLSSEMGRGRVGNGGKDGGMVGMLSHITVSSVVKMWAEECGA